MVRGRSHKGVKRKPKGDDDDVDDGHQNYGYDLGHIGQIIEFTPTTPPVNRCIGFVIFPDKPEPKVAKPKRRKR